MNILYTNNDIILSTKESMMVQFFSEDRQFDAKVLFY